MANSTTTQITIDGPRNVVVKLQGLLDTSDVSSTVVLDPALLSNIDNDLKASQLRINRIMYDVEDLLTVNLFWDATTPVAIWNLMGRGTIKTRDIGGIINNSGAGKTGKITMTTQGWSASAILSYSVILECVKQ